MPDPITLAVGAGIYAAGIVTSRIFHRRSKTSAETPPKPVCACEHPLALHDPDTKHCHGKVERSSYSTRKGTQSWYEDCTCRQYVGPQPVEEFFTQPLLPPEA